MKGFDRECGYPEKMRGVLGERRLLHYDQRLSRRLGISEMGRHVAWMIYLSRCGKPHEKKEGVDLLWRICKLIWITLRWARDCTLLGLEVGMFAKAIFLISPYHT